MPDRETVITHLQIIHTWAEFARERDLQFFTPKHLMDIAEWTDDTLELLKEQEAQKFLVDESGKITPLPVVVRCKDCIHWDIWPTEECGNPDSACFHNGWCKPNWFCADGKRKEGR